jgi:hypothetical protein
MRQYACQKCLEQRIEVSYSFSDYQFGIFHVPAKKEKQIFAALHILPHALQPQLGE